MSIDIPTLFVVIAAISLVHTLVIGLMAHQRHPDMGIWALALGMQSLACLFYALFGYESASLLIVGGNVALSSALALYGWGVNKLSGQHLHPALILAPIGLMAVGALISLHNFEAQALFVSSVFIFQCLLVILAMHWRRKSPLEMGERLIVWSAAIIAGMLLYRILAIGSGQTSLSQVSADSWVEGLTFLTMIASTALMTLGLVSTYQQRAETALQISEQHYRVLIETANEGIAVFQDGLLRFGNPKLFELLGYRPEEVLEHPFLTWVHEDDCDRAIEQYQARLAGDPVEPLQSFRVWTAHQGLRWFEAHGALLTWQGQPAALCFLTDVTERRDMQARIENQALHDSLTDLPNRRLLMHNLHLAMAAHRRNGLLGAVIFLDLDNFKPLNDRHGHRVGDLLLLEVAQRLRLNVRETDTVSRFGGDEFVVLLSDLQADEAASQAQALAIAEKLRAALGEPYRLNASTGPQHPRMVEHRCTASVGVVLFNGTQPDDMEDVLKRADMAMYQAKHAGRNSVYLAQ